MITPANLEDAGYRLVREADWDINSRAVWTKEFATAIEGSILFGNKAPLKIIFTIGTYEAHGINVGICYAKAVISLKNKRTLQLEYNACSNDCTIEEVELVMKRAYMVFNDT